MSRNGSMTMPTPRSVSATRKLALPSSPAGTASTVYISLPELDRDCRQENPDGDQGDYHGTAVGNDLRWQALRRFHAEVGEQVAHAVGDVKERHCDQHEQVQLDDGIAQHGHPGVVMAVDAGGNAPRNPGSLGQGKDRGNGPRGPPAPGGQKTKNEGWGGGTPSPPPPAARA